MTEVLIKSMRAAILVETNKPLVIEEINLPEKLEVGQVLVKLLYSGICGSQIGEIQGAKGVDKYLPHLLGHEGVGDVCTIGPGVTKVSNSDRVILHWRKGQGIDAQAPKYTLKGKAINAGQITTFNQYAIVSENRLTKLNETIALEGASLLGCAVTTGFGAVNNNAKLKIGESVIVFGAGGVGLNAIEGASLCGAYPIVVVDQYTDKLNFAKQFGATHLINSLEADLAANLKKILPNSCADVIIETTGVPALIELAYGISSPQGRVVLVGVAKAGNNISIHSLPLHFGKQLIGSHGGDSNPSEDIPRYARLAEQGKIKLQELVTEIFDFEKIQDGIDKMIRGESVGRCVLRF